MRQKVHYTWIGPVNQNGHDVAAVLKMAKQINPDETQLYFWCLDEYAAEYKKIFENTSVVVKEIQNFLHDKLDNARTQRMHNLLNKLLYDEGRGVVRDRVTLKEAFVFLLLGLKGGYALDSNVAPNTDEKINFFDYKTFHMLGIHFPVRQFRDADVGILYSPTNDSSHALAAFDYFMDKIEKIENKKAEIPYEEYKKEVLDVVIDAAFHNCDDLDFWSVQHLGANFPILLNFSESKRIIKHYANSHGAADRKPIPALHMAITKDDIDEVKRLLELGADVNEKTETEKYVNITPFNVASFYNKTDMIVLLKFYGSDPNILLTQKQNDRLSASFLTDIAGCFMRRSSTPGVTPNTTPNTTPYSDDGIGQRQDAISPSAF